jgi:YggT family protein
MFGIGNACVADGTVGSQTVCLLINFLPIAIIVRILVSWIPLITQKPLDEGNVFIQALRAVTDPILEPVRSLMPRGLMLDFSPMIVLIVLQVASRPLQELFINNGI